MTTTGATLRGFRPFLRKELSEWWQRRAAIVVFAAVGGLGIVGTLAIRIDELLGGAPTASELGSTSNVLGAKFEQWIVFASILASIGLLSQERTTGTLAWTLSKPISRRSVLLAKWVAAVGMLSVFAVVLPLTLSVAIATWSYGSVPDLGSVARFGLVLLALPAFFVALNLALATRLDSQAAIVAIAFAVLGAPYLFGGFLPAVVELWPTSIGAMAGPFAASGTLNPAVLASWAVVMAVAGTAAVVLFDREDM